MNLRYLAGSLISIPLLPLMYLQGKKIKASVPSLPEATNPEGLVDLNQDRTMKVITIGESTMAGVGVETHDHGFSGWLAKSLAEDLEVNIDWKVFAKSGYTVKKVTERIIPKIDVPDPDLIVIAMGGNDAFELNTPRKWQGDIINLIKSIQSKFDDTPIYFVNMPPIKDFPAFTPLIKFTIGNLVEIFGEELRKICTHHDNVYFLSDRIRLSQWIEKTGSSSDKDFFSDGVHPSELTYRIWAQESAKKITELMNRTFG
ncbi:MAG: SGNH/GDSL hydrolase family protein [Ekhidna sp.]|nr:SGNH/GDSL hydrolase family protein [Ekhidna sp.]